MKKRKMIVPPADIILDVINDEPHAEEYILKFYDSYIIAASKEACYNANGEYIGRVANSDLAQDIRLAVFSCLPDLRKAFYKKFIKKKPIFVFISSKEIE